MENANEGREGMVVDGDESGVLEISTREPACPVVPDPATVRANSCPSLLALQASRGVSRLGGAVRGFDPASAHAREEAASALWTGLGGWVTTSLVGGMNSTSSRSKPSRRSASPQSTAAESKSVATSSARPPAEGSGGFETTAGPWTERGPGFGRTGSAVATVSPYLPQVTGFGTLAVGLDGCC